MELEPEYWEPADPTYRVPLEPTYATVSTTLTRPLVRPASQAPSAGRRQTAAVRAPLAPRTSRPPREWPRMPHVQLHQPGATLWRVVKWPVRKALLGLYLLLMLVRAHRRAALVVCLLALALIAGSIFAAQRIRTQQRPAAATSPLVVVEHPGMPTLPASVQQFLHAQQRFNADEMWSSFTPAGRVALKLTQAQLRAQVAQQQATGIRFTRYIYTGGYQAPDGTAYYTIEAISSLHGQTTYSIWYFTVAKSGLITQRLELPAPLPAA